MNRCILKARLVLVAAILLLSSGAIMARLLYLQVARGDYYRSEALDQAQGIVKIELPRTQLLDRNGALLAASVERPSLCAVKPQELKDVDGLARAVSALNGEPAREIAERLRSRKAFTWIARKLPEESCAEAEKIVSCFDGVSLVMEWGRNYPHGAFASNLIGAAGMDGGLSGLEENWNERLSRGEKEYIIFRVGRRTKLYPMEAIHSIVPEPDSIKLTIDEAVQFEVERELDKVVEAYTPVSATAIVMSVPDGDVIAMGVRPTFDPNRPAETPFKKWRNIAVLDSYEPGSTFKVIPIAAALDSGQLRPYDQVPVGNGTMKIADHTIHDDHPPHKSYYSVEEVLTFSSNCGAARIGMALPRKTFYGYIRKFGFGSPTGIGLKGESPGLIRDPEKGNAWSALSAPSISFGQEVRATPLQLAAAYATIASGGLKVTPRIELDAPRQKGERVISEATARAVIDMLVNVVDEGTGKSAAIPFVEVGGKTGTAQKLGIKLEMGRKGRIAYFVGMAPAEDPKIVTLVMVDDPVGQIYGGAVSAPAFSEITSFALKRFSVPFRPYLKEEMALARGEAR